MSESQRFDSDSNEIPVWLENMVTFLDDGIRIPGTEKRIGWDAIIGLLPVVGDWLMLLPALCPIAVAIQRKLPWQVSARMIFNVLIDVLGGMVPLVGDYFDLVWKSNRKNLHLLRRHWR